MNDHSTTLNTLIESVANKAGLSPKLVKTALLALAVAAVILIIYLCFFNGSGFEVASANAQAASSSGATSNGGNAAADNGVVEKLSTEFDTPPDAAAGEAAGEVAVVYVTGAVNAPGLYTLSVQDRVGDAVAAAGGMTADAATQAVNLAEFLSDGTQIHIPRIGEVVADAPAAGSVATATSGAGGGSSTTAQSQGKVNINSADITALQTLTGIGPATAQKIIDYRKANGPFKSKEELKNVSGIGEKKYASIESSITV
jgi:competence protein ComEA